METTQQNKEEAAFEAELFNSLHFYGYLFPEGAEQVRAFEKRHSNDNKETLPLEKILSAAIDLFRLDHIDIDMGIAAFSDPDEQLPELPDGGTTNPDDTGKP